MSDSDDADLKRAIALSLQKNSPTPLGQKIVIDLVSSDDEDDDLDAPVSMQKFTPIKQPAQKIDHVADVDVVRDLVEKPKRTTNEENERMRQFLRAQNERSQDRTKAADPQPPPVGSGLLGLDRKSMEAERLARSQQKARMVEVGPTESRKRKVSITATPPEGQHSRQVKAKHSKPPLFAEDEIKIEESMRNFAPVSGSQSSNRPPLTKQPQTLPLRESILGNGDKAPSKDPARAINSNTLSFLDQQRALQASGVQFPDGVVKRTWVYGCPREDDIKIEEVFQKNDLELAVLSSFVLDPDWVASKLNDKTKVIWVLQAKTEEDNFRSGAPVNYRFCFPSMVGQVSCMHSKLQLLAHPSHLRVVIPSANLLPYDWGETGVMENVCFLIDLPRLPELRILDPSQTSEFGRELMHFVKAMGLDNKVVDSIGRFDFSRTSHLRFIHSIGGSHSGTSWKRTGYCGLGTAVRSLGLDADEALHVDAVAASIGNLTESFLNSLYLAIQGDDGWLEYGQTKKSSRGKAVETSVEAKLSDKLKDCFRIYFPTQETVATSKGGIGAGGTICFQSQWYDSNRFPRHLMRDCRNRRKGILLHSKILFVQPQNPHKAGRAWAYVGSANMSESAWGRLAKDKITKQPKLNLRNWECGVIIPVPVSAGLRGEDAASRENGDADQGPPDLEIFRGYVPVPMITPGEEYGTKRPWFWQEQQSG